jgi:hypothetical protein
MDVTLTALRLLSNNVLNVISGTCAKHISKTLGTLHSLSAEAVATICWLFTMSDQIHGVLCQNGSQESWENEAGDVHFETVEIIMSFLDENIDLRWQS